MSERERERVLYRSQNRVQREQTPEWRESTGVVVVEVGVRCLSFLFFCIGPLVTRHITVSFFFLWLNTIFVHIFLEKVLLSLQYFCNKF